MVVCRSVVAGQPIEYNQWAIDILALFILGRFAVTPNRGGGARSRACLKRTTWLWHSLLFRGSTLHQSRSKT